MSGILSVNRDGCRDETPRLKQGMMHLPMSQIGEVERRTQHRIVRLFVDQLGYRYLGNLADGDNRNIRESELETFLFTDPRYSETDDGAELMRRAVIELKKAAGNTGLHIYDRNREVYELLRYGVKVKADVSGNKERLSSRFSGRRNRAEGSVGLAAMA